MSEALLFTSISALKKSGDLDVEGLLEEPRAKDLYLQAQAAFNDPVKYSWDALTARGYDPKNKKLATSISATVLYELALYEICKRKLGDRFYPKLMTGSSAGFLSTVVAAEAVSLEDMALYIKHVIASFERIEKTGRYGRIEFDGIDPDILVGIAKPGEIEIKADSTPVKAILGFCIPEGTNDAEYLGELRAKIEPLTSSYKLVFPSHPGMHHQLFGAEAERKTGEIVDKMNINKPKTDIIVPCNDTEILATSPEQVREALRVHLFRTVENRRVVKKIGERGISRCYIIGPPEEKFKSLLKNHTPQIEARILSNRAQLYATDH